MLKPIKDWDDAFNNMGHIVGSQALPGLWSARAAAYRANGVRVEENIPYGDQPREVFDLVWPDGPAKGLVVFIHGGFWMRLDKSYWTDFADGVRANGWAVCIPSYTLAPHARINQMSQQMAAAVTNAATQVAGPIRLSGHSAGGHLATRLICEDTLLPAAVLNRIAKTVSISGLHDLRPLMQTKMNETLHLDEAEAQRESTALLRPAITTDLTCWVGGGERPEFIRQAQIMAQMWDGLETRTDCIIDAGHNHFTVIEALRDKSSRLVRKIIE